MTRWRTGITNTNEILLSQARNSDGLPDHSEVQEWWSTKLIDFTLVYTSTPANCLQSFIEQILSEIEEEEEKEEKEEEKRKKSRRREAKKGLRHCITALALNLWQIHRIDKACDTVYLAVSLNRNDYYKGKDKAFENISLTQFLAALDGMTALGYVTTYKKGFYRNEWQGGKRTSIAPTTKLLGELDRLTEGKDFLIRQRKTAAARSNGIVLRDKNKKSVKYRDNDSTRRYRANLKHINRLLLSTDITLEVPEHEKQRLLTALNLKADEDNHQKLYLDFSQVALRRVFNNRDWEQGGRFYGGWWQNVPGEFRQFIRLDGERTIELDYTAMHLTIVYAQEGRRPPENPYCPLPDLPPEKPVRDCGKYAFNALLNAADKFPRKPLKFRAIEKHCSISWEEYLTAILEYHEPIRHRLLTGDGLRLQFLDSQIAEQVLLHFAGTRVPCLPVHDSFIVPVKYEDELRSAMIKAAQDIAIVNLKVK